MTKRTLREYRKNFGINTWIVETIGVGGHGFIIEFEKHFEYRGLMHTLFASCESFDEIKKAAKV